MNKLTPAQSKRFDKEFLDKDGEYCTPCEEPWLSRHVKNIKQHLADELARERKDTKKEMIEKIEKAGNKAKDKYDYWLNPRIMNEMRVDVALAIGKEIYKLKNL